MPENSKLNAEQKIDILLHILNSVDEQGVMSFAEDKFEAYFNEFSRPIVENYLNALNNKKSLQFMVYGEPGMINEHFIKVTSPAKISKEIKLQIDMMKAKQKDMILAINEENNHLKDRLEAAENGKESSTKEPQSEEDLKFVQKIDDTLDYSNKLKRALKKNKNLEVLEGVVSDTQAYLNTVKEISVKYDEMHSHLIQPLLNENRKQMNRLTVSSVFAILIVTVISLLILLVFS